MSEPQRTPPTESHADAAHWLRAVRQARRLSQRELATKAQVPLSAITGIESGRRRPGLELVDRILTATNYRLAVIDVEADSLVPLDNFGDDDRDTPRDTGGRRLPAHLERDTDPTITERTFHHRPRQARGPLREHPWFGQFRGRDACHGPAAEPCRDCVGTCRYRDESAGRG